MLGAALCPLVTPYGVGIIAYYHTMLLGSSVMTNVSEWQPVTSVAKEAVPFFVAAAIALWLFGRNPSRTTLWEKLAVLVLIAAGIDVIRNLLFFGLFALMVMPVALAWGEHSEGKAAAPGRGPINAALADEPAKVNTDALGEGWFFKLKSINAADFAKLMTEAAYAEFVKGL